MHKIMITPHAYAALDADGGVRTRDGRWRKPSRQEAQP
jgi:hypothetical protein